MPVDPYLPSRREILTRQPPPSLSATRRLHLQHGEPTDAGFASVRAFSRPLQARYRDSSTEGTIPLLLGLCAPSWELTCARPVLHLPGLPSMPDPAT